VTVNGYKGKNALKDETSLKTVADYIPENAGEYFKLSGDGTHHCQSPDIFITELKTKSSWLSNRDPSRIGTTIFRGQCDGQLGLVPGIFRDNWKKKANSWLPEGFRPNELEQDRNPGTLSRLKVEHAAVLAFIEAADRSGIRLPGYNQETRARLNNQRDSVVEAAKESEYPREWAWPPTVGSNEFYPLIALAQHYGVPTRLLDWTFSPYIAAFFAAWNALWWKPEKEGGPQPRDLTVRGIAVGKQSTNLMELGWTLVRVPRQANERLRVQQAAFVTPASLRDMDTCPDLRYLRRTDVTMGCVSEVGCPFDFRIEILEQLDAMGINSRTMMPGYEGVVQHLRDQAKIAEVHMEMLAASNAGAGGSTENGD
jgi:FRG domain